MPISKSCPIWRARRRAAPGPAAFTRVGLKPGQFFFVPGMYLHDAVEFRTGSIHHLVEPDPMQEIYGCPNISRRCNRACSTRRHLFRRKYYINGSHAGFILYVSDENFTERDSEALREAMRRSKGPGNFRNFFMHIPRGKPDGVKIIPIGEVAPRTPSPRSRT
jgi:capsid portal protein